MKSIYISTVSCGTWLALFISWTAVATSAAPRFSPSSLWGRPYKVEEEEVLEKENNGPSWMGGGREFDLFDNRGGDEAAAGATGGPQSSTAKTPSYRRATPTSSTRTRRSSSSAYYPRKKSSSKTSSSPDTAKIFNIFQPVQDWWTSSNRPRLNIRAEPTTTIKIRKTFRPLKTILRLGADFNTQLGVWQYKSSWEDPLIGGKLTLVNGRELQLTKSWQLSVGVMEDLVTRLRFRAAVDLGTMKAYARIGFRTERLNPINFTEGFTIIQHFPLYGDSRKGTRTALEFKANFALPEPEIEYSTENNRSMVGMGDIDVNIEEINLLVDI